MKQSTSQNLRVGLFFLLGIALIWVAYDTLGTSGYGSPDGYRVTAPFDNLKQLRPGDAVRMSGVKIGVVEETDLVGGQAMAVLNIEPKYQIPLDSIAVITTSGMLGNNYISVAYGDDDTMLPDNGEIKTGKQADINEVIAKLGQFGDRLESFIGTLEGALGGGDGGPGEMLANINDLINENKGKIESTLTNLELITANLAEGKGTIGKLMNSDDAYNEIISAVDEIEFAAKGANQLFIDANAMIANLDKEGGLLTTLVNDQQVASDFKVTLSNVKDFSDRLSQPKGTLGLLMNDESLYYEAKGTLNKVNTALDSMNDSGPITAVGVGANALF